MSRGRLVAGERMRRLLVTPFLVVLLLLLIPAGTSAHAALVALDPVDGARLPASPTSVSLTFNENVSLAPGGLRVIRPDGSLADVGDNVVTGATVTQVIAPLDPGWYLMAWSIISADGHVVHGSATFEVGDAGGAARPGTGSVLPSPFEVLLWLVRGLADLASLVVAGAGMAWLLMGARTARVRRLWLGVLAIGLGALGTWLVIEIIDGGDAWLSTEYSLSGWLRLGLFALSLAVLLVRPARERAAAFASLAAVLTLAWGGHATGSPLTSVTQAIHLFAGVTWMGAAPALALVLWDRGVPDDAAMPVVRSFSRIATVALFVLIAAGSATALLLTNGLDAGITIYVLIVLGKLGVVGGAALMGAWGRRKLPTGDRRHYRRLFLTDAALLVVVALLSSALTLVGPHEGHAGHEGHVLTSPRCSMVVGQGDGAFGAAFVVDPGTAGSNDVLVSGVPATVQGVSVELLHPYADGSPVSVPLTASHHGWEGTAVLPFTGRWTVTALVRVDTFTEARGSCAFDVTP